MALEVPHGIVVVEFIRKDAIPGFVHGRMLHMRGKGKLLLPSFTTGDESACCDAA